MDFGKILSASLMIIGIGAALVLIQAILNVVVVLAPATVGPIPLKFILGLVQLVYSLLSFLLFAGLYFWAGMRAVQSYGLDPLSGGVISALSHTVVCIFSIIVSIVVGLIGAGGFALGMAGAGGTEAAAAGALFGGLSFMIGTAWTMVLGAVCLFGGIFLNFCLGFGGGLLVEKKPQAVAVKPVEKAITPDKVAEKKIEKK